MSIPCALLFHESYCNHWCANRSIFLVQYTRRIRLLLWEKNPLITYELVGWRPSDLSKINSFNAISVAYCKTAVTPVRKQWSHCSLVLNHRYTISHIIIYRGHKSSQNGGCWWHVTYMAPGHQRPSWWGRLVMRNDSVCITTEHMLSWYLGWLNSKHLLHFIWDIWVKIKSQNRTKHL